MPNINITVAEKIATNTTPGEVIVCGNSDYTVTFDLDSEWNAEAERTARFVYYRDGLSLYQDVAFTGNTVAVPVLSNISYVLVGVYAGSLHTTTPAKVLCDRSILCGDPLEVLTPEEKAKLQAQIGDLSQLQTNNKANLVAAINEAAQSGGNSSQNGNGLTSEQIAALDGMFQIVAFTADPTAAYAAFKAAFTQSDSGDSGGGEDSGGDSSGETVTTYTITNNLTNVSSDNDSASVTAGESYTATLTAADGYEMDSVSVTMGGADITSTVYADGVVNIAAVTGNVVITANAIEEQTTTVFTGTDLLADNGIAFINVTGDQYNAGMTYGLVADKEITLAAGTYYFYSVYKTTGGVAPKFYTEADGAFTDSTSAVATIAKSGAFKTGTYNEYGNETADYYQPNGAGYLVQITLTLSSDFTGYLQIGASGQCYVNTETGWTMLTTEQFNPFKQTLS